MPTGLFADAGVVEGQILAGKYRVERVLGVGGMGVVVAARHVELDEKVAIKFLLPPMLTDGVSVARFQREAKAAVRIKSEHVARVFDVGRLENGAPYIVMEFLEGSDLASWIAERGALPLPQALNFVLQTCVAVADAHALGIIHRDLKPANLFCIRRSDGQLWLKVLDFGISKLADSDGAGMSFTQTSAMMGSPLYMSPEQFRSSKNVDARTDVWAIGAILFELVTGKPPFTAGSVPELAIKVATEPPPFASQVNPAIPPELAAVIATCLERDVEKRYRGVAELAIALAPFAPPSARPLVERVVAISGGPVSGAEAEARWPRSSGTVAMPAGAGESRASIATDGTAHPVQWTSPGSPPRRGILRTLAFAGGLLGAAGAGAVWWVTERAVPTPSVAAPVPVAAASVGAAEASSITSALPAPSAAVTPVPAQAAATTSVPAPTEERPAAARERPAPMRTDAKRRAAAAPPAPVNAARPALTAETKPAPAAPAKCDPPFFFDSKGNRVFKQECL